ncbi:MAG: hypothetical protein V1897_17265 [Pseudomonadota bacterium]
MFTPTRKFKEESLNVELRRIYKLLGTLFQRINTDPDKPASPEVGTIYVYGATLEIWDGSSWTAI